MLLLIYFPTGCSKKSHRILWEDPKDYQGEKIIFSGIPYAFVGRKIFDCQHGRDRKERQKRKRKDADEVENTFCLFLKLLGFDECSFCSCFKSLDIKNNRNTRTT